MPKLYSFDVFDTCLIRTHAFPSDLFLTLARDFQEWLEPLLGTDYRLIFRDLRFESELRCLKSADREETTIREIWTTLVSMLPGLDAALGVEKELDVERNALRANPSVLNRVKKIRETQGRIVFISDTYLPHDFVCEMLIKHEFMAAGDACYVSSAVGLTKRTGTLFRHVLEAEALSPVDLVHYGDNPISDGAIPRNLGIPCVLCCTSGLSDYEKAVLRRMPTQDIEFCSRLAGAMRCLRLAAIDTNDEAVQHFVASLLGPLLFVFAIWVLARAQKDGIQRLYFLSRDGYALSRAAARLADRFGNIDCRYLQVSRQSLCLPCVTEISPQGMPWMSGPFERKTLGRLLATLELDVASAGQAFVDWAGSAGDDYELVSRDDWDRFWRLLNEEPLRGNILALAAVRRSRALQYFRGLGVFEKRQVAVVDLGWLLTSQWALRSLLRGEDATIDLRGYYLGLHLGRRSVSEAGGAQAMFYFHPGDRAAVTGNAEVFNRVPLLEAVFGCAPHGAVRHYDVSAVGAQVQAVCSEADPAQSLISEKLVSVVETFCDNVQSIANGATPDLQLVASQLIAEGFGFPDPKWIQVVGKITSSQDQNDIAPVILSAPHSWTAFLSSLLPSQLCKHVNTHNPKRYWPELSNMASSAGLVAAMRLRYIANRVLFHVKGLFSYSASR